jgi:Beta-L-arabinofuranosidase, GH127 middle domain/Beta-L-arabinofuranosidase, GH127 catalytic domain
MLSAGRDERETPMRHALTNARSIKLDGQLDLRMRHAIDRLAADRIFDETFVLQDIARAPNYHRQFEDWAGDLSGRYVGALAASAAYTGEHYPRLHDVAHSIPLFQRPSGLVGSYQPLDAIDFRVIWGQGRLLAGLMDYHAVFPSDDVLECARRLGDYYARSASAWSAEETRAQREYSYYTQGIEGLVALFRATGQETYLAQAQAMGRLSLEPQVSRADTPRHSHGLLLTLLGLLDLHEHTGETVFLHAVGEASVDIATRMVLVDGAPPEFFPWSERNEGCSIADWLHLNLRLGLVTGEAHYFEVAERVWRNALYSNQACNGGFCHRNFSADRRGYTGEGSEAWWCCSFHGLRGYCRLLHYLYTCAEDEVQVNFIEPSTVVLDLPRGRLGIAQETDYPGRGATTLRVIEAPADGVRLRVRCPRWASVEHVHLNGTPTRHTVQDGYVRLTQRVQTGDSVTVSFPIGLRLEPDDGMLGSVWFGPLLMTCEIPGGAACAVVVPTADAGGLLRLPPLDATDHPYAIAGTHFLVVGTGNPVSLPIDSLNLNQPQLGRLRPLAEQSVFPAPPPALVHPPIILADGVLLGAELAHLLGGRG